MAQKNPIPDTELLVQHSGMGLSRKAMGGESHRWRGALCSQPVSIEIKTHPCYAK